jgi:hypothetical protein
MTLQNLFDTLENMEAMAAKINKAAGEEASFVMPAYEEDAVHSYDLIKVFQRHLFIRLEVWKDEFTTPEICEKAVKWFGEYALSFIPGKFLSAKLYMMALPHILLNDSYNHWTVAFLKRIPDKYKTLELCLATVRQDAFALESVPDELRSAEICLAAVQQEGSMLRETPEKEKIASLCLTAVKKDGCALHYVPAYLKTPTLCKIAVRQEGAALEYVPKELKTAELCCTAVGKCGRALKFVPENLKTPEMCLMAVREEGYALQYVPENLKTTELCRAAVIESSWAFKWVPENLLSAEMFRAANRCSPVPQEVIDDMLTPVGSSHDYRSE